MQELKIDFGGYLLVVGKLNGVELYAEDATKDSTAVLLSFDEA